MEKAYSTITKVLIVCIVATIICTIIRVFYEIDTNVHVTLT